MNFWELIGLPSKKRIEDQNRIILDLNEVVKEIKMQQDSINSLIAKNEEDISESILLNRKVVNETKAKVNSLINDSENKNQELQQLLSNVNVISKEINKINESNFAESIQNSNNMNTKSFMQMYELINELDNRINSLEDNFIKQISKKLSLLKNNQEHITESILLNKEIVNETETKVMSLLTDSENKNRVLKELLLSIEETGNGVAKINKSNLPESIQSLNNMNTKSCMQIYNLINELNICISDLRRHSINPISKNLSVIEETLRLMLVNDLIDDAEEAMSYLKNG